MKSDSNNREQSKVVSFEEQLKTGKTMSLLDMITKVRAEPELKMIYSGIKENSLGIIFGPSKCGKTILCENLAMSIAAGERQFLGTPINIINRKVMFLSLEEHYKNRTDRNTKQVERLVAKHGADWLKNNYIVITDEMPRYISGEDHWYDLGWIIRKEKPGVVLIDSMTHLYDGSIEDSSVAKKVMQNLRELTEETKTTVIVIHHTHKMYDRPLSLDTIAGSRVIAQEIDFMIGLNRTANGQHYMKEVAFRYAPCNSETIKTFSIDDSCWLTFTGDADELDLLSAADGRRDTVNMDKLYEFMIEASEEGTKTISFGQINKEFVEQGEMSKPTVYSNIQKLLDLGKIDKVAKGEYAIA